MFAGRNLEHIRQIPEKLLDVTVQPLMFVLLFAYVFGGAIGVKGGTYREYLIAGILIQSLTFGLVGPATSISTDLTEGVVDRFRSFPRALGVPLGHFLAELVGWRCRSSSCSPRVHRRLAGAHRLAPLGDGALLAVHVLPLDGLDWDVIGLLVRSADAAMGIAFTVVFPITFMSAAFVPVQTLPDGPPVLRGLEPGERVGPQATRELFGNPTTPLRRSTAGRSTTR